MKKQLVIVGIAVLLVCVGLNGCTTNENQLSNGNNNQQESGTENQPQMNNFKV